MNDMKKTQRHLINRITTQSVPLSKWHLQR